MLLSHLLWLWYIEQLVKSVGVALSCPFYRSHSQPLTHITTYGAGSKYSTDSGAWLPGFKSWHHLVSAVQTWMSQIHHLKKMRILIVLSWELSELIYRGWQTNRYTFAVTQSLSSPALPSPVCTFASINPQCFPVSVWPWNSFWSGDNNLATVSLGWVLSWTCPWASSDNRFTCFPIP